MHGGPVRAAPTLQLSRAANTTTASARLRTQGRGAPHAAQNSGPGELSAENDIFLWAQLTSSFLELLL